MKDQLEALVAPLDDAEIDAALRRVRRRADRGRRTLVVVAGAAATAAGVVGAVAVLDRGDDPESVVTDGPQVTEEPSDDGWPWTTVSTAPVPAFGPADLTRVRAEVMDRTDDPDVLPYLRACCNDDGNPVLIELRADAVALAEEFWQRWGPAVDIQVGFRRYPTGEPTSPAAACIPLEAAGPIPGIEATLTVADSEVPSGGETRATLVVHNTSDKTFTVAHPKAGAVVNQGTADQVGVTARAFTMDLRTTDVLPGATITIDDIVIGTTSCAPTGPPGTTPGPYEAAVQLETLVPIQQTMLVRTPLTVGE